MLRQVVLRPGVAAVTPRQPIGRARRGRGSQTRCKPRASASDDEPAISTNRLAAVVRRKQAQVAAALQELGEEGLEERLQSATATPARPAYRLAQLIQDTIPTGRPVLVFELRRGALARSSAEIGALAAAAAAAGADALAVCTDAEHTAEGLGDLFAAVSSCRLPVLQRDWLLHPLQVAEAKEAGAAGVLGTIASVTSRGTPIMSSFAAAIGLDCPVEIINMAELRAMEAGGVPFYAMNISVGLSVRITGFGSDVAKGLLGELPLGAISLVGVSSIEEARAAREAGADSLLIKHECLEQCGGSAASLARLVEQLREATDGDD